MYFITCFINGVGLSFMRLIVFMKRQSQRMQLAGTHATQSDKGQKTVLLGHFLPAFKTSLCAGSVCAYVIGEYYLFNTFIKVPRG